MTANGKKAAGSGRAAPVFVTGVWKSGNHLVYSALNELGVAGPFNGLAAHLVFGRHAWAKRLARGALPGFGGIDVGLETRARVRPGYIRHTLRRLGGRIVGGHAAYSDAILELLQSEDARMICIRRDPRDILVSFADWIGSRPDYFLHPEFSGLDRDGRITLLLRGGHARGYQLNPFTEVLRRAEGWLTAPGVLQVAFEDLVGAKGGGDNGAQTRVLAALHAHVGAPKPLDSVAPGQIYGGSLTFNKGRAARWRELDNPALVDEIVDRLNPHLAKWGYAP